MNEDQFNALESWVQALARDIAASMVRGDYESSYALEDARERARALLVDEEPAEPQRCGDLTGFHG